MPTRLRMSQQSLKSIPPAGHWRSVSWICEAKFLQRIVHLPEVAGGAGDYSVAKTIVTSASMSKHMVVLSPQCLECSVLISVCISPRERLGIVSSE